jgi:hypothetical protein
MGWSDCTARSLFLHSHTFFRDIRVLADVLKSMHILRCRTRCSRFIIQKDHRLELKERNPCRRPSRQVSSLCGTNPPSSVALLAVPTVLFMSALGAWLCRGAGGVAGEESGESLGDCVAGAGSGDVNAETSLGVLRDVMRTVCDVGRGAWEKGHVSRYVPVAWKIISVSSSALSSRKVVWGRGACRRPGILVQFPWTCSWSAPPAARGGATKDRPNSLSDMSRDF